MDITKRQHYVWRYYLAQWTNSKSIEGDIYCCRGDKIFQTGLINIAQEKYFYELVDITDTEALCIERISLNGNEPKFLKEICLSWIQTYRLPYKTINALKACGINNPDLFDKILKEGEEKLYCKVEKIGKPYLERLYNEDLAFYEKDDEKADFNIFICEQYFRTKKRLESLNNSSSHGINVHKLWPVFRHIFATKLAFSLTYDANKKFKLFLIRNKTELNFITGDQPIINRYATKELQGKPIDNFELYYPITTKLALLLSEKNYSNNELYISSEIKVTELNDLIFYNSQEQVYAVTENELEKYKKLTRN